MKIHITENTFQGKLDLESLSTAPVWCFVLSVELLKHNGKWVIMHYMAFVFRYEILTSEKRVGLLGGEPRGRGGRGRPRDKDRGWESRNLATSLPAGLGLGFSSHKLGEIHTSRGMKRL